MGQSQQKDVKNFKTSVNRFLISNLIYVCTMEGFFNAREMNRK